eukprot:CAMPEP_0201114278 /NCGR_PEP_ID=MMETSP0812-20130820/78309_1 /ASSEMBLY_ACC=CAM_ASM_000668 /TAXON_ID=98059 /ORGANISM="Dinobryon sp., Strain UTEXLB2267" /LENGTH=479 /DNA_ID=CAMNT_0047377899 /DNA_START=9 /DNA_END=1448 /DNA_ORIENTATION=+
MIAIISIAAVLLAVGQVSGKYTEAALKDQIHSLPGTDAIKDQITFNQFSGYLSIPSSAGVADVKHVHYWLVESMQSPSTDPLAFWTNGGPGCSGFIGFMTEQGPFRPNADNTLSFNKYAWNTIASMVFIESPVGVGYSYSDDKDDLTTGDAQTALDNYNTIQAFLTRFPDFKSNPLYITSESYGGHYMPTLAKQIVDSNAEGKNFVLNFKGFAVGNPYTDPYSGTPAMIDTYWGHQLIAKPIYDDYQAKCVNSIRKNVKDCISLEISIMNGVGNLNPYALDYPVCVSSSSNMKTGYAQRLWLLHSKYSAYLSKDEIKSMGLSTTDEYEPCADDYSDTYLNNAAVKIALNVKPTIQWTSCSNRIKYNSTDSSSVSTAPIYNYLIDGGFGLNILVYSGDDDSVCGTVGTQSWIWGLGYTVSGSQWQTYTVDSQTAGYVTQWANTKLGFLTIHGAGHEVPTYKPEVALDMWSKYLNGDFTNK